MVVSRRERREKEEIDILAQVIKPKNLTKITYLKNLYNHVSLFSHYHIRVHIYLFFYEIFLFEIVCIYVDETGNSIR